MQFQKRHLTKHRRARLIAWSLAILAWVAWVFSADRAPSRRHMRQRFGFISLEGLARNVAMLILIRAAELAGVRYRQKPFFSHIRGRQLWPRHALRSVIGGRLRRALKHKDFTTRVAILTDALRRLDVWAARHVRRARRGRTRLWAIAPAPAPAVPIITLARPATFLADSS